MSDTTAKVSFKDKIKSLKITTFRFTNFRKEMTSPDEGTNVRKALIVFELETPIPKVSSSHSEWLPSKNQRVNPYVTDVKEVTVELDLIESDPEDKWVFDEDENGFKGSGSYEGDLLLDVSRGDRVWLTDVKLSRKSREWRDGKRNERLTKLFGEYEK